MSLGTHGATEFPKQAANQIRLTRSLGHDFFAADAKFENWQRGVSLVLTDLLLKADSHKFRDFVEGVKEGATAEESLKKAYDLTLEQLVARYGQTIGVANLKP